MTNKVAIQTGVDLIAQGIAVLRAEGFDTRLVEAWIKANNLKLGAARYSAAPYSVLTEELFI